MLLGRLYRSSFSPIFVRSSPYLALFWFSSLLVSLSSILISPFNGSLLICFCFHAPCRRFACYQSSYGPRLSADCRAQWTTVVYEAFHTWHESWVHSVFLPLIPARVFYLAPVQHESQVHISHLPFMRSETTVLVSHLALMHHTSRVHVFHLSMYMLSTFRSSELCQAYGTCFPISIQAARIIRTVFRLPTNTR